MSHATFVSKHPLPEGWSPPSFVEDTLIVDELTLARYGVAAVSPNGLEVTGSAASVGANPSARGYYELLERASIVGIEPERSAAWAVRDRAGTVRARVDPDAVFPLSLEPSRWRFARSNGVALHATWELACDRAYWELVERDRILRSWYGQAPPVLLAEPWGAQGLRNLERYDVCAYAFPSPPATWAAEVQVVGVFAFPKSRVLPFVCGYAARPDVALAAEAAESEALQQLAFLWGEEIPTEFPASAPFPLAHLERVLCPEHHERIRAWLAGHHVQYRQVVEQAEPRAPTLFVDLTPSWLMDLRVVKAMHESAMPLTFGEGPYSEHLPEELRLHPIA